VVPNLIMMDYWANEIKKWVQTIKLSKYSEENKEYNLRMTQLYGGVLLATYDMVVKNWWHLNGDHKQIWSLLILD